MSAAPITPAAAAAATPPAPGAARSRKVTVYVTLKPTLLDAQGRTVEGALHSLGYEDVANVRIGKVIEMEIGEAGDDEAVLRARVAGICDKLLANPVTESYRIEVSR
jgi:phosphoribosylformylglycinamidine synthase